MPKLLSAGNNESVFVTEAGARGYRLVGLEISAQPRVEALNALVRLGDGRADQGAGMPSDLILDRVYIHGTRSLSLQRCVMLSSAKSAIIDSWLSECHAEGIDSQAIVGWNGSGPYAIVNNYLEAAGENVMFGGANPGTVGLVPQDVIIRGNHFRKPDSWIGSRWSVKNLLELKFARRVLIEGNVFEGSWRNAQNGSALILKSSADVPWGNTEDVTIRFNRVRNVGNGFGLRGKEGSSTVNLRRVTIHDNVMDNVNVPPYIGDARLFTITGGVEDVSIVHNTMVSTGYLNALMALDQYPAIVRLTMNENILVKGEYGIKASGAYSGSGSLDRAVHGGYEFKRNVIVGTTNDAYPPSTAFVASIEGIGFSIPGRDYRLAARSFRRAGTGNRDLGADVRTLDSLTATVTVKIPGR